MVHLTKRHPLKLRGAFGLEIGYPDYNIPETLISYVTPVTYPLLAYAKYGKTVNF